MATAPRQLPRPPFMAMALRKEPIPHRVLIARPGPGPYGAQPGTYPQTQYVAPPPSAGTAGKQLITNGPQTNPGDVSPSWSAQRNVVESEQYERQLKGNQAFRQVRMRKECGPITDPQLHRQCLDSFARY